MVSPTPHQTFSKAEGQRGVIVKYMTVSRLLENPRSKSERGLSGICMSIRRLAVTREVLAFRFQPAELWCRESLCRPAEQRTAHTGKEQERSIDSLKI